MAALDTAAGSARAHVGAVLWEWSLGDIADDACLVVSELVTNAVLSTRAAGRHDPVRIWVLGDHGGGALFLVWDATMPGPVRRASCPMVKSSTAVLIDSGAHRHDCAPSSRWKLKGISSDFAAQQPGEAGARGRVVQKKRSFMMPNGLVGAAVVTNSL